MKLSLRLAQILEQHGVPVHGAITKICQHQPQLKRHQVSAVLNNTTKYLCLEVLGGISDYLAEKLGIDKNDLPGILFAQEAEDFWDLLTLGSHDVTACLGVRSSPNDADNGFVVAADADLYVNLLHQIRGASYNDGSGRTGTLPRFPDLRLVPAQGREPLKEQVEGVKNPAEVAQEIFENFHRLTEDRALIALGSMKSNSVVELPLARAFDASPFTSQEVETPNQRSCPVFFRYRKNDPKPSSCAGGTSLAKSVPQTKSGIYYEKADGSWECCPCDGTQDAALVFYLYRPTLGCVEMLLSGYSGRSTRWLAKVLRDQPEKFWPPTYAKGDKRYGVYIVKFKFSRKSATEGNGSQPSEPTSVEVIGVSSEAVGRRVDAQKADSP